MKRILTVLCTLLICIMALAPLAAHGVTPIDPEKPSSLQVQYRYGETAFSGLNCRIYRVAEVNADGTYTLTGDFAQYPVNIYGIVSQAEWKNIASTLAAYAMADQISPDRQAFTDPKGIVAFRDILPGMYLTLGMTAQNEQEIVTFETFLTVVPYPSEDGNHNYDVQVYPKAQSKTPEPDPVEYKVVKQWKDLGNAQHRPQTVTVDILKNGVKQSTQILSADNDWCYRWSAPDDGSSWQAVERNVPSDYMVTVVENGSTIVITNVYDNEPEPPKTGEIMVLWPFLLLMCFAGGLLIILSIWAMRKQS